MGKKRTKGKNQRRALRDRLMRQALDKETIKGKRNIQLTFFWFTTEKENKGISGCILMEAMLKESRQRTSGSSMSSPKGLP